MQTETGLFIQDQQIVWETVTPGVRTKLLAHCDQLMMVKVEFESNAVGSPHSHPHVQISFVESGRFEVQIKEVKKILTAGDVSGFLQIKIHGVVCREKSILIDVLNQPGKVFLK